MRPGWAVQGTVIDARVAFARRQADRIAAEQLDELDTLVDLEEAQPHLRLV